MKNILLRTNLVVSIVIVCGFIATSVISYHSNHGIFLKNVENVSALSAQGISRQIESIFTRPISVSLTMANDSLLKEFLLAEPSRPLNAASESMRRYLDGYRQKYGYDSVFLASAATHRYYHFKGLDRVLTAGEAENVWYYSFLQSGVEYSLNIDNDEAAGNEITVFVNCRISGPNHTTLGVVGVGFRVDHLQALLQAYESRFGVQAYLIGPTGVVKASTTDWGLGKDFFQTPLFTGLRDKILKRDSTQQFWHNAQEQRLYVVTQYLPELDWHIVVMQDTRTLVDSLNAQFFRNMLIILAILTCVLLVISRVIRACNAQIVQLTHAVEQKRRFIFQEATAQLYEHISEVDITHNCAANADTARFFESFGTKPDTPYDQALRLFAEKRVMAEFRPGYMDMFSPAGVLKARAEGRNTLQYDLVVSSDNGTLYWMRLTARVFRWDEDDSVRMLLYHQNIDAQKQRELLLSEQAQKDPLTGLLNKVATQECIKHRLERRPETRFAFFIVDIDKFKTVNDTLGHDVGDSVLTEFTRVFKGSFREGDVLGRIGGDEFVAFFQISDVMAAEKKAEQLIVALFRELRTKAQGRNITASAGIAISPDTGSDFETLYRQADTALYQAKGKGGNGFALYREE